MCEYENRTVKEWSKFLKVHVGKEQKKFLV